MRLSHFDVRSRYTDELGRAIARVFDTNCMRTIVKTARADSSLSGAASTSPFPDGNTILSAAVAGTLAADSGGAAWHEALREMRIDAGTANIPDGDPLYVAMPYNTFDALKYSQVNDTANNPFLVAGRDFAGSTEIGNGVAGSLTVEGITVMRTNLMPSANDTANSDVKSKYRADFSTTLAVGWHRDAVGTVKLIGMGLEQTRDTRRQEDFIVAKMAVGHGPLRNEGAWEFRDT
jgi:hypothetical protein